MGGYLRIAGRLNYVTLYPTRHAPYPSIRHFSVVFQHPKPHIPQPYLATIRNSRSFWGFSSPSRKPPSSQPPNISTDERPVIDGPQASVPVEDVSVAGAAAPETIWTDTVEPLTSNPISESSVNALQDLTVDTITQVTIPPLHYGSLADLGLIGWHPVGLVRWSLEAIQITTGMPWFWTIVAGTAFWRMVVLPVIISSSRNAARTIFYAPQIEAAQRRLAAPDKTADPHQLRIELAIAYKKLGINPLVSLFAAFVQLPVAIGVFLGIKGMCELPVEQLKNSGFDFLPDLTALTSVADPYWILPLMAMVGMNMQMKLSAREGDPTKPERLHILNAFRLTFPFGAIFMSHLPVGVMVSVVTGIAMSSLTSVVLHRAVVRRILNIPPLPAKPPKIPTLMESRAAFYKYMKEQREATYAQRRDR